MERRDGSASGAAGEPRAILHRVRVLDVGVFAGIVLLGSTRLPTPFTGDQALNMLLGRLVANGGALYVDLWDLKHPGIFFFFSAAGWLFGFTEIGIHLFELAWMLALAVVVRVMAAQFLESKIAVSLAPALTVGFYYGASTSYHQTQTEALVGLPLLVSLAAAVTAVKPGSRRPLAWFFVSGLCAGVVVVFKAPYVLLTGAFWILAFVDLRRRKVKDSALRMPRLAASTLVGLLLPVGACVVYLADRGALGLAWWTFTVHPRQAATQTTIVDLQLLVDSTISFVRTFGVLLILALIGAAARVRRGWDLLPAALLAWMVVGLLLSWAQVIGWYSYHYFLALVPMGLLATQGVETLWTTVAAKSLPRHQRAAAVTAILGVIVVSVPMIDTAGRSVARVLGARPIPLDDVSARRFQAAHDPAYDRALRTTSFLHAPESHRGAIYVFGNPINYVLADRPPAISVLATWFHPTNELWDRMIGELEADPPAYILVADEGLAFFTDHNPDLSDDVRALRSWLGENYDPFRSDVGGTWYLRGDLARSTAP